MNFIHCFPDDKFAKVIFKQFEFLQIRNVYCVFSENKVLKFVDFPAKRITKNEINQAFIEYVNSFDGLFIHFLGPEIRLLLSHASLKIKVFWIGWGGDYYWLINDIHSFEIFKPLTYQNRYKLPYYPLTNTIFKRLRKILHSPLRKILNRIDFFSPVLKMEFDIIKNNYSYNFQYFDWNYGSLEDDFILKNFNLEDEADCILFGNSSTFPNNFFDLFHAFKKLNLNQVVYCPLTYGDKNLRKQIIKIGKLSFDRFIPIVDHLDYESYMSILKKCRNVIMGHLRQQALGTILTLIYLGSNVFLYRDSVLFHYFDNIGIKLKSIEELLENPKLLDYRAPTEEIITIRKILLSKWGKDFNQKCGLDLLNLF